MTKCESVSFIQEEIASQKLSFSAAAPPSSIFLHKHHSNTIQTQTQTQTSLSAARQSSIFSKNTIQEGNVRGSTVELYGP